MTFNFVWFAITVFNFAVFGQNESYNMAGNWECYQTSIKSSSLGTPSPFNLTVNSDNTGGNFIDNIYCQNGCEFDSKFSQSSTALTGFYSRSGDNSAYGMWSIALNASGQIIGLTQHFSSSSVYLIDCKLDQNHKGKPEEDTLSGSWNGEEYRMSSSGEGEASYLQMRMTKDTGEFTDDFGCTSGCKITPDYGYNGYLLRGYYHDPNGNVHGIWFMYSQDNGVPFVSTYSYASDYSYIVTWEKGPACSNDNRDCYVPTYNFSSNCGAWIIWRRVGGTSIEVHQAFAYDDNWKSGEDPSFSINSGYYSCGNNHNSDTCVKCHLLAREEDVIDCLGRVCADTSSLVNDYQVLLSYEGLAIVAPVEFEKTCWFLDPSKGQTLNCDILWETELELMEDWNECYNPQVPHYNLFSRNCRDYIEAVMDKYCSKVGATTPECTC